MNTLKKNLLLATVFTLVSLVAPAQNKNTQEQKVLQLSETLWKAMQEVNTEVLTQYIAPEAVFVHMGATLTRDKEIEVLQQKTIILKDVATEETSVRIVGKTAVLLRKMKLTAIVGGNEVVNPFVVTESYTPKGKQWLLAALSYTRIVY